MHQALCTAAIDRPAAMYAHLNHPCMVFSDRPPAPTSLVRLFNLAASQTLSLLTPLPSWPQPNSNSLCPQLTPTRPPTDPQPTSKAVSAALGYLVLLIDRVAFIMGGPVLHEALPQGSTSTVWVPGSFWDRQPRRQEHALPLSVPGTGTGSGGAGGGGASSSVAALAGGGGGGRQGGGGGGFWQIALGRTQVERTSSDGGGITRSASETSAGGDGGGGTPRALGLLSSRREVDAQAAFGLLQRSLACFLRDKAASSALQLPAAWNPLAWLVVFCAVVKRDAKADGKLVAASLSVDSSPQGASQQQQKQGAGGGGGAAGGGFGSGQGDDAIGGGSRGPRASRESLDPGSVMALLEDGEGGGEQQAPLPQGPEPWNGAWAFDGKVVGLGGG